NPVTPRLAARPRQKGKPDQQGMRALAPPLPALAQRPVLLLETRHAPPRLGVGLRAPPSPRPAPSSPEAAFFQLRFGFQGTRAPAGELIRHVAEHRLQLIQHAPVNSLSVVRQARPPALAALLPAARPLRSLSAYRRGPGMRG